MKPGDKIRLKRRHSGINGWSIRSDLDGKVVTVVEIEDRVNGGITAEFCGRTLYFFRDAVGEVLQEPKEPREELK